MAGNGSRLMSIRLFGGLTALGPVVTLAIGAAISGAWWLIGLGLVFGATILGTWLLIWRFQSEQLIKAGWRW